jgi:hypothetical protein
MKIPIRLIAPLACDRPDDVRRYIAMLRARPEATGDLGREAATRHPLPLPDIDGAHRVRAARRVGQKTIEARIIAVE